MNIAWANLGKPRGAKLESKIINNKGNHDRSAA